MATLLENLKARRDAIGVKLAELGDTSLDLPGAGGPIDVDRVGKIDGWYRELKWLNEQIALQEGGIAETESYGLV